jgi:signal transduction histidine kinase
MGLLQRHRWFVAAGGLTLFFAAVSLTARKGPDLTACADLVGLAAMLVAAVAMLANALKRPGPQRSFWILMALGFALWACNQAVWAYDEILEHHAVSNPCVHDLVLFFHLLPMIAAVAWRPDQVKSEGGVRLSRLNFLMLAGWWGFVYAFLVFPHQFAVLNVAVYSGYYDFLYLLENGMLATVLGLAAWTASGGWRRLYLNLLAPAVVCGIDSLLLGRAVTNRTYYSGSLYDVSLIGAALWMAATAISASAWDLQSVSPPLRAPWRKILTRLAMLAILSLPVLGLWTLFLDNSPLPSRVFRIFAVLTGMLVLGAFVFLRQYLQDQALIGVLQESRRSYDTQMRLQKQLVQKEKLASLGTLVAGAAHEIDHPLTAIMTYSEQLWAEERLTQEQKALLRKISNHVQRTRDLVANLLSFARQSPGEKVLVDLNLLLSRALQMLESHYPGGKIRVSLSISADLPRVRGNPNQLFQVCIEIIENAIDVLREAGGGSLEITAQKRGNEAVLQFSDSGPGIREPERVFDPFYTTKPVGKGAGLGLSVVYGVIQDHGGQITCQNKPEGGALFVVRFPTAAEPAAQGAGAAGS